MVYDTDVTKSCFMLNELTTGTFQNKRGKARLQLQNTLHDLMKDADTKAYISSFNNKQCILSCRKELEPISPFDMTAGLIWLSKLFRRILYSRLSLLKD